MATSNTIPVVIPQPIAAQATSENINVIPNGATGTNGASFQEGFPAITRMPVIENPLPTQVSGLPPKQQDFNGLFNVVSQHNFFAQNGGSYTFNQAVSDAIGGYPKNAVLWYFPENEDPCLVYSLINDNTNNFVEDPTLIDDKHWKKLSFGGGGVEEPDRPINDYQVNNVYSYGMSQYYKGTMNNNSWLKSAGQWNSGTVYTGMYNWLLEQMNAGIKGFKGNIGYAWKSQTADIRFWTAIRNPSVGCAVYGGVGIPFVGNVTAINPDGTLNFYEDSTGVTYENLVYTESENINIEGTAFGNLKFANDYDFVINTTDQTFRLPLLNGEENWVGNTSQTLSTADIVAGTPFTWIATKNGFVKFTCYKRDKTQVVIARINGQDLIFSGTATATTTPRPGFWLKVKREDIVSIAAENDTLTNVGITFIPAVGNGSLYYYIGDTLQNAQLVNVARIEETLVTKTNKVQAAEASMPSNRYIDLTLGASGSTYTAPANGWFVISGRATADSGYCSLDTNNYEPTYMTTNNSGWYDRGFIPVRKGQVITLRYGNYEIEADRFKFIYAEGEK